MTRYYDLTKMSPEDLMKDLIQHCMKANTISQLNRQCINAADTGVITDSWLSEEEMDEINFHPNIYRG